MAWRGIWADLEARFTHDTLNRSLQIPVEDYGDTWLEALATNKWQIDEFRARGVSDLCDLYGIEPHLYVCRKPYQYDRGGDDIPSGHWVGCVPQGWRQWGPEVGWPPPCRWMKWYGDPETLTEADPETLEHARKAGWKW